MKKIVSLSFLLVFLAACAGGPRAIVRWENSDGQYVYFPTMSLKKAQELVRRSREERVFLTDRDGEVVMRVFHPVILPEGTRVYEEAISLGVR